MTLGKGEHRRYNLRLRPVGAAALTPERQGGRVAGRGVEGGRGREGLGLRWGASRGADRPRGRRRRRSRRGGRGGRRRRAPGARARRGERGGRYSGRLRFAPRFAAFLFAPPPPPSPPPLPPRSSPFRPGRRRDAPRVRRPDRRGPSRRPDHPPRRRRLPGEPRPRSRPPRRGPPMKLHSPPSPVPSYRHAPTARERGTASSRRATAGARTLALRRPPAYCPGRRDANGSRAPSRRPPGTSRTAPETVGELSSWTRLRRPPDVAPAASAAARPGVRPRRGVARPCRGPTSRRVPRSGRRPGPPTMGAPGPKTAPRSGRRRQGLADAKALTRFDGKARVPKLYKETGGSNKARALLTLPGGPSKGNQEDTPINFRWTVGGPRPSGPGRRGRNNSKVPINHQTNESIHKSQA